MVRNFLYRLKIYLKSFHIIIEIAATRTNLVYFRVLGLVWLGLPQVGYQSKAFYREKWSEPGPCCKMVPGDHYPSIWLVYSRCSRITLHNYKWKLLFKPNTTGGFLFLHHIAGIFGIREGLDFLSVRVLGPRLVYFFCLWLKTFGCTLTHIWWWPINQYSTSCNFQSPVIFNRLEFHIPRIFCGTGERLWIIPRCLPCRRWVTSNFASKPLVVVKFIYM